MSEERAAFGLKDSGARRQFSTGSQRDNSAGKGAFSLMAFLPLFREAVVYEKGDIKYGDTPRNWERGQNFARLYESAIRHVLMAALKFRDEDHLAQAVWNLRAIMHFEMTGRTELDDMPDYGDEVRAGLLAFFDEQRSIVNEMAAAKADRMARDV